MHYALLKNGHEIDIPKSQGITTVYEVNSPYYLEFLTNIYIRWQKIPNASPEVIPNIHPNRKAGEIPESPIGHADWYLADSACPIGMETWNSELASANTAADAA